jgi:hypothetical protein
VPTLATVSPSPSRANISSQPGEDRFFIFKFAGSTDGSLAFSTGSATSRKSSFILLTFKSHHNMLKKTSQAGH